MSNISGYGRHQRHVFWGWGPGARFRLGSKGYGVALPLPFWLKCGPLLRWDYRRTGVVALDYGLWVWLHLVLVV